jgi:hypothetical protein
MLYFPASPSVVLPAVAATIDAATGYPTADYPAGCCGGQDHNTMIGAKIRQRRALVIPEGAADPRAQFNQKLPSGWLCLAPRGGGWMASPAQSAVCAARERPHLPLFVRPSLPVNRSNGNVGWLVRSFGTTG